MKKTMISVVAALMALAATASTPKDSIPNNFRTLQPDDPELMEIDRMLVSSYTNHFCFSTDKDFLNAYNYQQEEVPTFPTDVVRARMDLLDRNTPFELTYNSTVQGFIDLYAMRRRDITSKVLGMSQLYFPMIEEKLSKHNIPLEMKYLAIVESALNPSAISRAGAGGLWQFMVATGKMYNLEVTSYQDERFDAYKSTEAACLYLKFLYKTFGNWELALAAYNSGPGNVNKAIRRSGGKKDFWAIKEYLPKETQGYVPAFIAVAYVMNHAAEYNLYPQKPLTTFFETDTVTVTNKVDFQTLASIIDMPVDDIAFLNATYKLREIPQNGHRHYLVLPIEKVGLFMSNEDLVYEKSRGYRQEPTLLASTSAGSSTVSKEIKELGWKNHTIKPGESLGAIASKYKVSVTDLKKWNNLKSNTIHKGQSLKIRTMVSKTVYVETSSPKEKQVAAVEKESEATAMNKTENEPVDEDNYQDHDKTPLAKSVKSTPVKSSAPQYKYYTIQKGDTLTKIANSKGVTVNQIKNLNKGLKENSLAIGQKIKIKEI
jgi:membrane-bound lytic murein transglycosylase D